MLTREYHNGPYVVSCDKLNGCHTAIELEGNDRAHALLDAQRLGWFLQGKTCLCPDCFQEGAKRLLQMIFEEEETCH